MAAHKQTKHVYVFLGKTGVGKSSTCNTILGEKRFKASAKQKAVTQLCEWGECVEASTGREIAVIDTPGVFDTCRDHEVVLKEIARCVSIAMTQSNGIDAFILVLKIGDRFTEENVRSLKLLKGLFKEEMMKYVVVLFTRKGDLDDDDTLLDYIQDVPVYLSDFLTACDHRVVAFDNKTKDKEEIKLQVGELVRLVDGIREKNGHQPFQNEVTRRVKEVVDEDSTNYRSAREHADAIANDESPIVEKVLKIFVEGIAKAADVVVGTFKSIADAVGKVLSFKL